MAEYSNTSPYFATNRKGVSLDFLVPTLLTLSMHTDQTY